MSRVMRLSTFFLQLGFGDKLGLVSISIMSSQIKVALKSLF